MDYIVLLYQDAATFNMTDAERAQVGAWFEAGAK